MDDIELCETDILSQELLSMFDASSLGMVVVDRQYNVTYSNDVGCGVCDSIVGINFLPLLMDDSADLFITAVKACLLHNKPLTTMEVEFKNGRSALIYSSPLVSLDEQCLMLNIVDITRYKIVENDLIHLQKIYTLGQFTASIVHDFNNYLTAIMVSCDLVMEQHQKQNLSLIELGHIQETSKRAANLISGVSSFINKSNNSIGIVNIADLVNNLMPMLTRLLGKGIKLVTELDKDLSIMIEDGKLEQVIINLVVNARDAMIYRGTLTISANRVTIDENFLIDCDRIDVGDTSLELGDYALIKISDTGSGIGEHVLDNIFEPFVSTKNDSGGMGLGLSTVLRIVKQFNGHIQIQTKENIGSSFYIFLKAIK